ncbi:orotidine-5'-phosphate decarboxylase [Candidatus Ishikawella capsulata]|uniref:Orotidine 5'-phosphate decarboxylase n=1 Tax=Candidatus Ishikawaella capsulata Mpkobe TaxID=476281 RepID=C5WC95_9ENTR|nr:orotidine-5'-phosphate decarboxylase [Candidatus Ishikawaella capsulata]BAH82951.1 orotidine 5'-phosphate decarboxylase [Candidatus Ishikawaella capsulata Mpkobe]
MTNLHKKNNSPVILALDYKNLNETLSLVDCIDPESCRLKVGKEMFTLFGPYLVKLLQERGFEVFLDLKFYDIPNTTGRAVAAAAELGVWMLNLHANGGTRMMNTARKILDSLGKDAPKLIAVTILTSMEKQDLYEIGIHSTPFEHAERLARLAYECNLDGVVCSPKEANHFKQIFGKDFILVTPGIRFINSDMDEDDQRRIMTPQQAHLSGADYIVVGRPVTESTNPIFTLTSIINSFK